ncbi:hypothetical protein GCM10017576_23370 [Microbacterium barkeri]|uniref:Uncharacterized protein n=1 Tax=Microbacterium barkeri TaxID=33917 RepID=A0A9W6H416_9MICO|nr:hypothetical protein [Microbacterium barkeri]MDI6944194.1 hypothetical protein [Microbacterium barkeri]MDR6876766.1 hypothetical protein [Microbacterium barkeri]GLJ62207.1 hypothetical protein GCM10017576_23370 [Microbacterium barkeri]
MDLHELLELLKQATDIAASSASDGYEIVRPHLHTAAQALADFLAEGH